MKDLQWIEYLIGDEELDKEYIYLRTKPIDGEYPDGTKFFSRTYHQRIKR